MKNYGGVARPPFRLDSIKKIRDYLKLPTHDALGRLKLTLTRYDVALKLMRYHQSQIEACERFLAQEQERLNRLSASATD